MKKWLVAAGLGMAMVVSTGAQAATNIAVVNMGSLFQQVAQKSGVSKTMENEFKGRANELQSMRSSGQAKAERLQRDGAKMKAAERTKLEKELMADQAAFAKKAQAFEQDQRRRSDEERAKLVTRIDSAMKKVADDKGYDVVLDVNAVPYVGKNVKDITSDVLQQVK